MFRFKIPHLILMLGLSAPLSLYAASFCIAVDGGFGSGGTTYVAPTFVMPAANGCSPWAGFTKTASTVILVASGTGCLATNGKSLQFSISMQDPQFFSAGTLVSDYITVCKEGVSGCTAIVSDQGFFSSSDVKEITCTATLLKFPQGHD